MKQQELHAAIVCLYGYLESRTADRPEDLRVQMEGYERYLQGIVRFIQNRQWGPSQWTLDFLVISEGHTAPGRIDSAAESVRPRLETILTQNGLSNLTPLLLEERATNAPENIWYSYRLIRKQGIHPARGSLVFCDTYRTFKVRLLLWLCLPWRDAVRFRVIGIDRPDTGPASSYLHQFKQAMRLLLTVRQWRPRLLADN